MESNADKNMRDKLKGIELPFDPQAWEQMEAMLDQKKKRRGVFWWWFGGVAALMVLGAGGYQWLLHNTEPAAIAAREGYTNTGVQGATGHSGNTATYAFSKKPGATGAIEGTRGMHQLPVAKTTKKEQTPAEKETAMAVNHTAPTKKETPATISTEPKRTETGGAGKQANNNTNSVNPVANATGQNDKKGKRQETEPGKHGGEPEWQTPNAAEKTEPEEKQMAELLLEVEQLRLASGQADSLQALAATNNVAGNPLADSVVTAEHGKENNKATTTENTSKVKPKIFAYQLGARADLMGSLATAGPMDSTKNGIAIAPTYRAGIFQEMILWNRLSFYTGVVYAYNTFKVKKPVISNSSLTEQFDPITGTGYFYKYQSYISRTHELVFPVGIKAYILNKPHINFFVHAGVFNHVKIKEEFLVDITTTTYVSNVTNIPTAGDVTQTSVVDNPFTKGAVAANGLTAASGQNYMDARRAEAFGINGTGRYYASLYASAGVEFILKKDFRLIAEPMYSLLLSHIGGQEGRKLHNFGLSLGFKYGFGK